MALDDETTRRLARHDRRIEQLETRVERHQRLVDAIVEATRKVADQLIQDAEEGRR